MPRIPTFQAKLVPGQVAVKKMYTHLDFKGHGKKRKMTDNISI
jgi:hypothetical protein